MTYDIRIISPQLTRPLRHKVLWPHIERVEDCIIDIDEREDAIHLGVFDGDRLVSVGSLFAMTTPKLHQQKVYRLRAMATDPDYRGKQSGRALIEKAVELLKEKRTEVLWCDARKNAVGFYKALGFSQLPEEYEVPKIGPHYFMWIDLK